MIDQINKNELYYKKDVIQTKSFDERQRKEYFEKEPHLDMIDLAILKLKELQHSDNDAKEILLAFDQRLKEKSEHMQMLDEMLLKFNEKKYDAEDLYFKIMGPSKSIFTECPNSVFYSWVSKKKETPPNWFIFILYLSKDSLIPSKRTAINLKLIWIIINKYKLDKICITG